MKRRKIAACLLAFTLCAGMITPVYADADDTTVQIEAVTEEGSTAEIDDKDAEDTGAQADQEKADTVTDTEVAEAETADTEEDETDRSEAESEATNETEVNAEADTDVDAVAETDAETVTPTDSEAEIIAEPETEEAAPEEETETTDASEYEDDTNVTDTAAVEEADSESPAELEEDTESDDDIEEDTVEKSNESDWYEWDEETSTVTLKGQLPNEAYLYNITPNIEPKKVIINPGTKAGTSLSGIFAYSSIKRIDGLSNLDTSKVTDMNHMFAWCSLTSIDVSCLDTSKVTNMEGMFEDCESLKTLDLSKWDTSKVQSMKSMFANCVSLTSIDFSGFDTRNVENMQLMFNNCTSLTSINVSSFDTSLVEGMGLMFVECKSLTSLNLSGWNMGLVCDSNSFGNMFSGSSIKSLDLSGCIFPREENMRGFFNGIDSLTSIKLPMGFKVTSDMGLPNNDGRYYGWLKKNISGNNIEYARTTSSSAKIISGSEYYAVFGVDISPTITKIEPGNCKMNVTWKALSGASSYNVYYKRYDDYNEPNYVTRTGTGALINGLENDKYEIWVTAVIKGRETIEENKVTTTLKDYGINVSVKANGSPTNVTLSWKRFTGATKYRIVCVDKDFNVKTTRETAGTSFYWNGLGANVQYGFYVQPYINGLYPTFIRTDKLDKSYIKIYTAKTAPTVASPKITKVSTGNHKAWVNFTKVTGATSYRIYVIQNGKERLAGSTTANKFLVTGMTNGVKAYYYVKALVNGKLTTQKYTAYSTPRDGIYPITSQGGRMGQVYWYPYTGSTKYQIVVVDKKRNIILTSYIPTASLSYDNPNGILGAVITITNYDQFSYSERRGYYLNLTLASVYDYKNGQHGFRNDKCIASCYISASNDYLDLGNYGIYIVPYVNGELIPFGRSHADDQEYIAYFTDSY